MFRQVALRMPQYLDVACRSLHLLGCSILRSQIHRAHLFRIRTVAVANGLLGGYQAYVYQKLVPQKEEIGVPPKGLCGS